MTGFSPSLRPGSRRSPRPPSRPRAVPSETSPFAGGQIFSYQRWYRAARNTSVQAALLLGGEHARRAGLHRPGDQRAQPRSRLPDDPPERSGASQRLRRLSLALRRIEAISNRELPPCLFERVCPTCMVESGGTSSQPEPACRKPQREYVKKHRDELKCGPVSPLDPRGRGRGLVDVAADLVLSVLRIDAVLPDGGSRPMGAFSSSTSLNSTSTPTTSAALPSSSSGSPAPASR